VPTLIRNWFVYHYLILLFIDTNNRTVFIPTQIINFAFVPPHLGFVFVGIVSLFWSMYFSFLFDIKILHYSADANEVLFLVV
jgi:hypothetical protein